MSSLHRNKLYITAPQASKEYGLCVSTWRNLIRDGHISTYRVPGVRGTFLHRHEVAALFRSMTQDSKVGMDKEKVGVASPTSNLTTQKHAEKFEP